jgi:hypothetical protein
MKAFCLSLIMICSIMTIWAGITHHYEFMDPEFSNTQQGIQINLAGSQSYGNPSEPDLPWFAYKLLLPVGSEAHEVVVKRSDMVSYTLDDIIMPIQSQYPISHGAIETWDKPAEEIYLSDVIFPKQAGKGLRTDFLNGHPIASGAFSPFDYNPQKGELTFYRKVDVEVICGATPRALAATNMLKRDPFISQRLKVSVDNHSEIPEYQSFRETGWEYLMIVDGDKTAQWQPLVNYYNNLGISVMLQPIDQILANTPGQDVQEKIRNFIIYIYTENPLRYVLLGGDTDLIPHRGFHVHISTEYTDDDIAADMYYSCLDGNWNTNNNALWGELPEADLAPELALGRICYNNDAEIANQINKIIMYQSSPVESSIKTAVMAGELMDEVPTYGGDYMDELIGESDNHSYSTAGVPTDWEIDTLYDRTSSWNSSEMLSFLATGPNLVNHLGHSNTSYNMKISNYQVTTNNIFNDGINQNYSIYFTQGCYAGSFDNRGVESQAYGEDCITERFTALPGSALGMISHSRYGWYVRGSTNGVSQRFHREYLDALFGEGINNLGYALVDSKIDNISYITNSPHMLYTTYNTNLFGCPATSVWTDTPASIVMNLPSSWLVDITQYSIQTNAPNAQFKIKRGENVYYEGFADDAGLINIDLQEGFSPGNYVIFITAANFYPCSQNIFVTASDMPYIVCENVTTSDPDGILEIGDMLDISMTIMNLGMVDLGNGGTINLISDSENIQILQGEYSFGAVSTTDSLFIEDAFQIEIVGSFADRTEVILTFMASFDGYETESLHSLELSAPVLNILSYTLHGDNPYIMPGDDANIDLNIQNTGRGTASGLTMIISTSDENLTLHSSELSLPVLGASENIELEDAFSFSISPDAELGSDIIIDYMLWADSGTEVEGSFIIHVGMLSFDFETDQQDWNFSLLHPNFINQWHHSSDDNFTEGGTYSMKFGGEDHTEYSCSAYGALTSPEIELAPSSRLRFQHKMDAQNHATLPNQAWDGGNVQMSINGAAWFLIEPDGAYPYSIHNSAVSPFSMGTPVYSGTFDWTEAVFDLEQYSGTVRIRFVFGSDDSVCGDGWYIDDIHLECDLPTSTGECFAPELFTMDQNFPNPFNPNTHISFTLPKAQPAQLSVYNLKGQLIKRLLDANLPAGQNTVSWDGTDDRGTAVSSGIYSYRLYSDGKSITRKMLMMK